MKIATLRLTIERTGGRAEGKEKAAVEPRARRTKSALFVGIVDAVWAAEGSFTAWSCLETCARRLTLRYVPASLTGN